MVLAQPKKASGAASPTKAGAAAASPSVRTLLPAEAAPDGPEPSDEFGVPFCPVAAASGDGGEGEEKPEGAVPQEKRNPGPIASHAPRVRSRICRPSDQAIRPGSSHGCASGACHKQAEPVAVVSNLPQSTRATGRAHARHRDILCV